MPRIYTDDEKPSYRTTKLFRRERPLHQLLGGGKVADVLLWRDTRISAGIVMGLTIIWLLFEVVEYNLVTLLCHISITLMLIIFIWSNIADLLKIEVPRQPDLHLSRRVREISFIIYNNLSRLMTELYDIACGKDLKLFLLAIVALWMISVIGSACSSLTLLYFGSICLFTVPVLYERYEHEVDHFATRGHHDIQKLYQKFDTKVLDKIPRGPVKKKKI